MDLQSSINTSRNSSQGQAAAYNNSELGISTSVAKDVRNKNKRRDYLRDYLIKIITESNIFLELPLAELESVVSESLLGHPQISYGDVPVWSDEESEDDEVIENELVESGFDDLDSDDSRVLADLHDILEVPEYEPSDDTRDEAEDIPGEIGSAEGIYSYSIRRLRADFANEDEKTKETMRYLLVEALQPELSRGSKGKQSTTTPAWCHTWLNDVLADYGGVLTDAGHDEDYQANLPDIIFSYDDAGLTYEINMGILDEIVIPQNAVGNINITDGSGVPVAILRHFIAKRKAALGIVADFLIQNQTKAITSKTISDAIRSLEPIQQKDLIANIQSLEIDVSIDKSANPDPDVAYKEMKQLASRMLKGKYVQLPCSDTPIPALALFGRPVRNLKENERALNVLKTAFDLHINTNNGKPLTTEEQAKIISEVIGVEYSKDKVRKTLWQELKREYPEKQWPLLKLTGERGRLSEDNLMKDDELVALCDKIRENMGMM